jgi:hypothetical protein
MISVRPKKNVIGNVKKPVFLELIKLYPLRWFDIFKQRRPQGTG